TRTSLQTVSCPELLPARKVTGLLEEVHALQLFLLARRRAPGRVQVPPVVRAEWVAVLHSSGPLRCATRTVYFPANLAVAASVCLRDSTTGSPRLPSAVSRLDQVRWSVRRSGPRHPAARSG